MNAIDDENQVEPEISNFKRYLLVLKQIRAERGEFCEVCGVPAKHAHHIYPVSESSIHSELVYDPANLLILCDNCHLLMHPGIRRTDWLKIRKGRGQAIRRA